MLWHRQNGPPAWLQGSEDLCQDLSFLLDVFKNIVRTDHVELLLERHLSRIYLVERDGRNSRGRVPQTRLEHVTAADLKLG